MCVSACPVARSAPMIRSPIAMNVFRRDRAIGIRRSSVYQGPCTGSDCRQFVLHYQTLTNHTVTDTDRSEGVAQIRSDATPLGRRIPVNFAIR